MNIHVGNLARETTEEQLKQEFAAFGQVASVSIIKDRGTGVSKGFAFIEMAEDEAGQAAIEGLKGKTLNERTLDVTEGRPRTGGSKGAWDRKGGGRGFKGGKGGSHSGGRK